MKQRLGPMLGRKSFRTAAVVTSGIELAEKIQKGQFPDRHALRTHGNNAGNLAGRPGCVGRLLLIDEANTTDWVPVRDLQQNPTVFWNEY